MPQLSECSQRLKMSASKWLSEKTVRWPRWIQKFTKHTGTLLLLLALHFITLYEMRNSFTGIELRNVGN